MKVTMGRAVTTKSAEPAGSINRAVSLIDYENAVRDRSRFSQHNRAVSLLWLIFCQIAIFFWFLYKSKIFLDINGSLSSPNPATSVVKSVLYVLPFISFSFIHAFIWHNTQRRMRHQIENYRDLFGYIDYLRFGEGGKEETKFTDQLVKTRYANKAEFFRGNLFARDETEPFIYFTFQVFVILFWVFVLILYR